MEILLRSVMTENLKASGSETTFCHPENLSHQNLIMDAVPGYLITSSCMASVTENSACIFLHALLLGDK
jgi:hypothetical protein